MEKQFTGEKLKGLPDMNASPPEYSKVASHGRVVKKGRVGVNEGCEDRGSCLGGTFSNILGDVGGKVDTDRWSEGCISCGLRECADIH